MDDELQLSDYWKALKANWIVSSIAFLAVFGIILAYTLISQPIYEATSQVLVTGQDQTTFLLGGTVGKVADLETQRQIILSSSVMNSVYLKFPKDSFGLEVTPIKNSNVIEITIESLSPENSMVIANKIAESYIDFMRDSKKVEALENTKFISEQIERYTIELDTLNAQELYFINISKNMTKEQQINYQTLKRELSAKNKIYDSLLLKKEEAGIAANEQSGSVKILSHAYPPQKPVRPNVPLNLALGVVLGAGAALATAMIGNQFQQTDARKKKFNW